MSLDLFRPVTNEIGDISQGIQRSLSRARAQFDSDEEVNNIAKAKRAAAIETGISKNKDLLAQPDKLDSFVASNLSDIYPFAKKPDTKGQELKTAGIDSALKDHPLAGVATAVKQKFAAALADPKYATVSHAQLLDAVKKDTLAAPGTNGKSLIDKVDEYKYKKDNSPFRFFSDKGDTNVIASPTYEAFKAKKKLEEPYNTSALESVALGAGFQLALGLVTGGASVPAQLGMGVLRAAAIAVPEFALFDKIGNEVAKTRTDKSNPSIGELATEFVAGGLGMVGGTKLVKAGTSAALSKAMQFDKTAKAAAVAASFTGTATKALEAFTAKGAAEQAAKQAESAAAIAKSELAQTQRAKVLSDIDTQSKQFTEELKGFDSPEAVGFLRERLDKLHIDPVNAHVMGLDAEAYKAAKSSPSTLFSALSEPGAEEAMTAIASGTELGEDAVIRIFNREAALKKLDMLDSGANAFELKKAAEKAYKISMEDLIATEPKVGKGSGKHGLGGKIHPVEINLTGTFTEHAGEIAPSMDALLTGEGLKVEKGVSGSGLGSKIATVPKMFGLGVAGVVAGGAVLGDADESHAGLIDSAIKAGGKVFNSVAAEAVSHAKFPESVTVQGESLWNQFKKFGTTKAEFADLGLDKLKAGTKVTKSELSKLIEDKGLKIGEDVYGKHISVTEYNATRYRLDAEYTAGKLPTEGYKKAIAELDTAFEANKEPQFGSYKAIKSEEGVVPGSYREEFVTAPNAGKSFVQQTPEELLQSKNAGLITNSEYQSMLERGGYQDTIGTPWKDPHSNYSSTENPIGRFRYDIQVQPDGKKVMRIQEVQQGFKDTDPNVPQSLRDRWQEITVKKAIARAKAEDVDGISWATGEQQRSLYDNALRNVADEARYNPATKELHILKDGRPVSGYPKVVEADGIAEHIGKDPAKRLLESEKNFDHAYKTQKDLSGSNALYILENGGTVTAPWGQGYGKEDIPQFKKMLENNPEAVFSTSKVIPEKAVHKITDLSMDAQWPGKLYGDFSESGFNNKATIPSLLQKHGKGELGVLESGEIRGKHKSDLLFIDSSGNPIAHRRAEVLLQQGENVRTRTEGVILSNERQLNNYMEIPPNGSGSKQPVMWLNEKTPSSFSLYSHPAAVLGVSLGAAGVAVQASGGTDGQSLAADTMEKVKERSVMDSILSFLGPKEAQASPVSAAGVMVNKVVGKSVLESVDGAVDKFLSEVLEKRLVSMPLAKGQVTLPVMQEQLVTAPKLGRGVDAINSTVKTFKSPVDGIAKYLSKNGFRMVYGTTENSITVQLASMENAITNNTQRAMEVVKNILDPALGGAKETKAITEFMKPIQAEYHGIALPLRAIEIETPKLQKELANFKELVGAEGVDQEFIAASIKDTEKKLSGLSAQYAEYAPKYESVLKKYNEAKDYLLTNYKSSRISYALEEPSLMKEGKYASLYTAEEKAAVQQLSDVYNGYKERSIASGMEVLSGPYNHHSMDMASLNQKFADILTDMGIQTESKNISLTSYFGRSKYSKQMIPDITRNMMEYIPDAEKRINVSKFWDKKSQNGWHAFSQNELIRSNKVWNEYFESLKNAYNPQANTTMNKLADKYASLETLRLLTFAPSAAFKHFFKNEGTWATLGFFNSMKHMPESVIVASRNAANDALYASGISAKMLPKGALDDFTRSMIKQRTMTSPLTEMERDPGLVSSFDTMLQRLNNVGGVGIRAVEAFDRTHTILAALDMSLKKGMTAEQAMAAIYDTILKNNFLGGTLNPDWMRNPKVRALFLFQNTPFKIMERRLINGLTTVGDIKTAFGVIKNRDIATNLAELQGLGKYIMEGQNEFKQHLIYDALTGSKDAFGSSISAQFMREAIITGGVVMGGSALGVNFHKHSFHLPFVKEGSSPELAINPLVQAGWSTAFGKEVADDKAFFPSRFLSNYLKTTGGAQPLILHKMERLSNNDIPEIYKGSSWKYLFSVPAAH